MYYVRDTVVPMADSDQKIVMKIDDDVLMDPISFKTFLSLYLSDQPPTPDELACRVNTEGTVSRDIESKW